MKKMIAVAMLSIAMLGVAAADEYDNEIGFTAIEPTDLQVWVQACKEIVIPFAAPDCEQGPNATTTVSWEPGKVFARWPAELMAKVNARMPYVRQRLSIDSHQFVDRLNIAYREMRRRGIPSKEAIALCNDPSIVTAYVNARAGIVPTPNVRIEMK
jgi:hypothetical protein